MDQQFAINENVYGADTICGIWRNAKVEQIDAACVQLRFEFNSTKQPVLTETITDIYNPLSWPVRKMQSPRYNKDGPRYPTRRRLTPAGNPSSIGEAELQATGLFGYSASQLGYNPAYLTTLKPVSCFVLFFYV